jgi:hypothetical protein
LRSRTIAEALAVIELLDERIAPLHQELRPFAAPTRVVLLRTIPGIRERGSDWPSRPRSTSSGTLPARWSAPSTTGRNGPDEGRRVRVRTSSRLGATADRLRGRRELLLFPLGDAVNGRGEKGASDGS